MAAGMLEVSQVVTTWLADGPNTRRTQPVNASALAFDPGPGMTYTGSLLNTRCPNALCR